MLQLQKLFVKKRQVYHVYRGCDIINSAETTHPDVQ